MGRWIRILVAGVIPFLLALGAVALPDLLVSDIRIEPSFPQAGQLVRIEVEILNQGDAAASRPFFVHFFVDGREIAIRSIGGGIAPGRSKRASAEWTALVGLHEMSVEADPSISLIDESDEDNNTAVRALRVSLSPEIEAAIGSMKVAVASFDDVSGAGFFRVGEGVADRLTEQLSGIGIRVIGRSDLQAIMQDRGLNPSLLADTASASRLLGADLLVVGSVTDLEVRDSTLQLGFLSISGAEVNARLFADLVDVQTLMIAGSVSGEGYAEGATGFSFNLSGLLSVLPEATPDLCSGGLQTARSWYNVGESVPIAYRNPAAPGWFSIEITTSIGSFVKLLGWQYIGTNDCDLWYWDQLSTAGAQLSPGIYVAKLWDGTAYVAETGFQIRPGISLTISPLTEVTMGTPQFDESVVGSALDIAGNDLLTGLIGALAAAGSTLPDRRESSQFADFLFFTREGQIAAVLPDGRVAINIGASSGVTAGDVFAVLEVANVIVDSETLAVLSYDTLGVKGEVLVTEIRDRACYAAPMSAFEPAVGDIARWPSP